MDRGPRLSAHSELLFVRKSQGGCVGCASPPSNTDASLCCFNFFVFLLELVAGVIVRMDFFFLSKVPDLVPHILYEEDRMIIAMDRGQVGFMQWMWHHRHRWQQYT
jgi:hypothetical protein